jgi:plastocyanin
MRTSFRFLSIFTLGCACTLLAQDARPNLRIEQKERAFSTTSITIHSGDKLEFCNIDEVAHNVFSKSTTNAFNIRTQVPGSSSLVEFRDPGVTEVRCAIHPSMKLIVTVIP